jgi:hypothetical protein
MYFVVMPRVNLIVILVTYVHYLYSIYCPTVICLSSILLFILWRDATSELWTLVQFPLHCFTVLLLLALFTLLALLLSFVHSKPVRLITSSKLGAKFLVVLCAGFTLLLVKSYTPTSSCLAPLFEVSRS